MNGASCYLNGVGFNDRLRHRWDRKETIWSLDVTFHADGRRARGGNALANLAAIKRPVRSLLRQKKRTRFRCGKMLHVRTRRRMRVYSDQVRTELMHHFEHAGPRADLHRPNQEFVSRQPIAKSRGGWTISDGHPLQFAPDGAADRQPDSAESARLIPEASSRILEMRCAAYSDRESAKHRDSEGF